MSLFKRLPFGSKSSSWPPFPGDAQAEFPSLQSRFNLLSEHVDPAFVEHDAAASTHQRTYRRLRLFLIVGALLTTVFGAVQAMFGDAAWPGVVLAIIAAGTAAVTGYEKQANPLRNYLIERAKAEELRSLYFTYLGGLEPTDEEGLMRTVARIQFQVEETVDE